MKRILGIFTVCITFAAVPAACGGDEAGPGEGGSEPGVGTGATKAHASNRAGARKKSSPRSPRRGASVKVMKSRYGTVLFDGKGRALYLFTSDITSRSRCFGDCASAWPPFLTRGKPRAGGGATQSLLGTVRRRDGKTQVSYRGHPLYYYTGDRRPGQILCQDVEEFGGTWLVVSPSGRPVR
jgi:predicted lipoprotein with Yx(FWY)xxD motif